MPTTPNTSPAGRNRNSLKDYFLLGPVFGYFFRKPDPTNKPNFSLRTMHTINKISMLMFLAGIVFFIIKMILRSR